MPSLTLTDLQVQLLGAVAANMELTITATGDWQKVTDIMGYASTASTKARWNELARKLKTQSTTTTDGAAEPRTPGKTPAKRKTATKEEDGDQADTPTPKRSRKPTKKTEQAEQRETAVVQEEDTEGEE